MNVLFVGNSFTHGHAAPTMTYNSATITDANGLNLGGLPAIFKQFTVQTGIDCNVTLEAVSGRTLGYHLGKSAVIGAPGWTAVVLQGQSTEALPRPHGGNPARFMADAVALRDLVLAKNRSAKVYLYETWSSPRALPTQHYPDNDAGLRLMQKDLQAAAYAAFARGRFAAVVRVGDAMMLALDQGIGFHIPFADEPPQTPMADAFDLYDPEDVRHASKYGYYLAAALMYAKITKHDPRQLHAGPGTAAASLGITPTQAARLHLLAYQVNALPDPPMATGGTPTIVTPTIVTPTIITPTIVPPTR